MSQDSNKSHPAQKATIPNLAKESKLWRKTKICNDSIFTCNVINVDTNDKFLFAFIFIDEKVNKGVWGQK